MAVMLVTAVPVHAQVTDPIERARIIALIEVLLERIAELQAQQTTKDICPNLVGVQSTQPAGTSYYTEYSKCLTDSEYEKLAEADNHSEYCEALWDDISANLKTLRAYQTETQTEVDKIKTNGGGLFGGLQSTISYYKNSRQPEETRLNNLHSDLTVEHSLRCD